MAPPTSDRSSRVAELFARALALSTDRRTAFLQEECAGDGELREELASLLASQERAGSFLEQPAVAALHQPGQRVGAYRLLEQIGAGGMGTVWRAERADQEFEKQVALKLIRGSHTSDELHERFRHERQVLARLEHPNIARLLDGGAAPDGRPYLVMELVAGQPIDLDCEHRRLTLDARLRLFLKVCGAVQQSSLFL